MANIPLGDFAQARVTPQATPSRPDMRAMDAGRGAAALAKGLDDVGDVLQGIAQQKQQQENAVTAAEAQVALQRRTNDSSIALAEWQDRASRPGYNLDDSEKDLTQALSSIETPQIPGLSPDRKILYNGAIQNMDADVLAKAGSMRKSIYANRAEAAFSAGTDVLSTRATDPNVDIKTLYGNADIMGATAAANLPVDTVQIKVRAAKEAISAGRIATIMAGAQTVDALDALEKDVGNDKYILDGTKKAAYLSAITNKRNTLQNRAENERAAADRAAERATNDLESWAKSGLPPKPMDVVLKLQAAKGTPFESRALNAATMIDVNKAFYTMPLAQAEAELKAETYKARHNPDGNKDPGFMKSALTAAEQIVTERKALATKFPIEALRADTGMEFEAPAYDNPEKLAVQIRQRMDAVDAYRMRQGIPGIPGNPFDEAEQGNFTDIVTKAPGDQARVNILLAVAKAVDSPAEFREVAGVLKQNSPINYAVGQLLAISKAGGERTASQIYQGQKVMESKAMPLPSAQMMQAAYAEKVGAAMDPSSDEYAAGYLRFSRLYASRATADMGSETMDGQTTEWAFSMATGGVADTDFGKVVKPYGMRSTELVEKLPGAIRQAATAGGLQLTDLDDYEIEPRPDYNGQYYLIGPDGTVEADRKSGKPIIVKVK